MELMNQPLTGQLGNRLLELLDSQEYQILNIVVAFAKNSGVLRIKDGLEKFRGRGGKFNIYLGIDLGGTSYEALTSLLLLTDSLNVVHSEKGQTFHPKIYQLLGHDKGVMVVGSHNLTGGGLWTNFESSIIAPLVNSNTDDIKILNRFDEYINELNLLNDSIMKLSSQDDVEKLLENGYVFKEVAERVKRAKAEKGNLNKESLFGNGTPAKLPKITKHNKNETDLASEITTEPISISTDEKDPTIWFETRKLTGGSRNILDLSMRSLIVRGSPKGTSFDLNDPQFMRGGVEFFGLNPTSTGEVKNLTINFEGIDYADNTILFPVGANANGTWRLQIKGVSSAGNKITDTFRNKGNAHYLVEKIVTFTKINDDYYFMSAYPESELKNFEAASFILAHNGSSRNAKKLGLL
jgi:HKD family nuclease